MEEKEVDNALGFSRELHKLMNEYNRNSESVIKGLEVKAIDFSLSKSEEIKYTVNIITDIGEDVDKVSWIPPDEGFNHPNLDETQEFLDKVKRVK